jgi:hypothetical protein
MEKFIKDEVSRNYRNLKQFLRQHEVTDSTYYRVAADSPVIGEEQYRRLEGALDLPTGILDYIAEGQPDDMGSEFQRDLWDIYLLRVTNQQRERMVVRLEEKYAAGEYRRDVG